MLPYECVTTAGVAMQHPPASHLRHASRTMEQRHVVYIAAAAVTAGTVAACHLIFNHHSLHVFRHNSKGSSSIPRYFRNGSSCSTHVMAPLVATTAEQVVSLCQWDWAQSLEEVLVEMQLPRNVAQQDVQVKLQQQHLTVWVGQQCIINGTLAGHIQPQHSSWRVEGKGSHRVVSISLCKAPPSGTEERFAIWTSLLLTEDDTAASADQVDKV